MTILIRPYGAQQPQLLARYPLTDHKVGIVIIIVNLIYHINLTKGLPPAERHGLLLSTGRDHFYQQVHDNRDHPDGDDNDDDNDNDNGEDNDDDNDDDNDHRRRPAARETTSFIFSLTDKDTGITRSATATL